MSDIPVGIAPGTDWASRCPAPMLGMQCIQCGIGALPMTHGTGQLGFSFSGPTALIASASVPVAPHI